MCIPCAKAITWYVVAAMFRIFVVPPADGGFVPSEMIAPSGIDRDADIDRIQRFIETKIVRERLAELNFPKEEITSRLAELSDAQSYAEAIETLFAVAYTVKFQIKRSQEIDYGVMPLESLWWADDMSAFTTGDKAKWKWTAMIMHPSFVTAKIVADAVADVKKKKNPSALGKLRFESLGEGTCAQTLHVGPFSEEGPTVARVHEFIRARGARLAGKHHEIYLSDLRKAAPEKWKTVVRQPMADWPGEHHG